MEDFFQILCSFQNVPTLTIKNIRDLNNIDIEIESIAICREIASLEIVSTYCAVLINDVIS